MTFLLIYAIIGCVCGAYYTPRSLRSITDTHPAGNDNSPTFGTLLHNAGKGKKMLVFILSFLCVVALWPLFILDSIISTVKTIRGKIHK